MGSWNRRAPLDLQPAEDRGNWKNTNLPIESEGGSRIAGIGEVEAAAGCSVGEVPRRERIELCMETDAIDGRPGRKGLGGVEESD